MNNPIISTISSTLTLTFAQNIGLYDAFRVSIIPIFADIAQILFWCSVVYGAYYVMQMRYSEGVNRIKYAMIGYIVFKMADGFMKLVDNIAQNMQF